MGLLRGRCLTPNFHIFPFLVQLLTQFVASCCDARPPALIKPVFSAALLTAAFFPPPASSVFVSKHALSAYTKWRSHPYDDILSG